MMDITHGRHGGNHYSTRAHKRTDKVRDLYRLYNLMFSHWPDGLTAEEASTLTGMPYTTCSARFTEMKTYHWIEHCGSRPTRTENLAGVWRVVKEDAE
jgi:hypothetical protein